MKGVGQRRGEHLPDYVGLQFARRGCEIDGCERPHTARGLCMRHYCQKTRNKKGIVDSPGVENAESHEPLNEHEFCTMKDLRAQGFTRLDVAFELKKNQTVVASTWEFETYTQYTRWMKRGNEKPWPTHAELSAM